MFGYIIVNKAELKFKEFDVYHSYYCGLCRELKEKYGALGQLSLSYDMTFLVILLSSLYEPETEEGSCKCIAHPFEKHPYRRNAVTEYLAGINVLLTCYKCRDDWEDERKVTKWIYGKLLEGRFGKAKLFYKDKLERLVLLMQDFYDAEKENADIDTISGLFGRIMSEVISYREDEWSESLRRFGFYLGKFIYLLDAYEDVETDIRKGNYNPLKDIYGRSDFEEECRTILTLMMSECCKEFEQLPLLEDLEILRNILYSGVWCRYETVREKRQK
ncbi:MAG: DUF5685 family protein [Roseburia sp.]|nr:DUF5685 family protein [Roseburia sp.]